MANQSLPVERCTEKLDFRVSPSVKSKLQAAATATHRKVSEFVLESALSRAEETLAERRVFGLDAEKWAAFQAALDAPAQSLPRLNKLLDEPGFFNTDSAR